MADCSTLSTAKLHTAGFESLAPAILSPNAYIPDGRLADKPYEYRLLAPGDALDHVRQKAESVAPREGLLLFSVQKGSIIKCKDLLDRKSQIGGKDHTLMLRTAFWLKRRVGHAKGLCLNIATMAGTKVARIPLRSFKIT